MERTLTNYELALWLAQGNGQKINEDGKKSTNHIYFDSDDSLPYGCLVRKWGDSIWHKATQDYCNNGRL